MKKIVLTLLFILGVFALSGFTVWLANVSDATLEPATLELLNRADQSAAPTDITKTAQSTAYAHALGAFAAKDQDPLAIGKAYLDQVSSLNFWEIRNCPEENGSPESKPCLPPLPTYDSERMRPPDVCRSSNFCVEYNNDVEAFLTSTQHLADRMDVFRKHGIIGVSPGHYLADPSALIQLKLWEIQQLHWSAKLARANSEGTTRFDQELALILEQWTVFNQLLIKSLSLPQSAIAARVTLGGLQRNRSFLSKLVQTYPQAKSSAQVSAQGFPANWDSEKILENVKSFELKAFQTILSGFKTSQRAQKLFNLQTTDINAKIDIESEQSRLYERWLLNCCLLVNASLNEATKIMNSQAPTVPSPDWIRLRNPMGARLMVFFAGFSENVSKRLREDIQKLSQPITIED